MLPNTSSPFGTPAKNPLPVDEEYTFILDPDIEKRITAGTHRAKVIGANMSTSSNGNPLLKLDFAIVAGSDNGKELPAFIAATPAASWKMKEALVALGLAGEKDATVTLKPSTFINKTCMVKVVDSEYEGKMRSKIEGFSAIH